MGILGTEYKTTKDLEDSLNQRKLAQRWRRAGLGLLISSAVWWGPLGMVTIEESLTPIQLWSMTMNEIQVGLSLMSVPFIVVVGAIQTAFGTFCLIRGIRMGGRPSLSLTARERFWKWAMIIFGILAFAFWITLPVVRGRIWEPGLFEETIITAAIFTGLSILAYYRYKRLKESTGT